MNPTLNVNIGGYPFIIDNNAFDKLQDYLNIIENHFSASEGCDEIVHDIELRFAELLNERSNKRPIVSVRDVEQAIKILGTPEDFGADIGFDNATAHEEAPNTKSQPTGRRLFRDPKDKVISGVCSGIAAYLGINDPVWVRLLFVIFTAAGGSGALVYIFLMIAVPKAKTHMDRLAMQGKPINVENIAQQIEDGINNLTYTIDEMSDRFTSKKKR